MQSVQWNERSRSMDDLRAVLTPKKKQSHRHQLLSFAGILVSFMVLLSLLSYSSEDQANGEIRAGDLWKVFTNDEVILEKARQTGNILGLGGAMLANILINSTIGYAVLILPVLGLFWSVALLRRRDFRPLLVLTNYVVVLGILFAAISGAIRLTGDEPLLATEWSGVVGDFLASVLSKLIGLVGTYLLLIGLFGTMVILLFDIDVLHTYQSFKNGFNRSADWLDRVL